MIKSSLHGLDFRPVLQRGSEAFGHLRFNIGLGLYTTDNIE